MTTALQSLRHSHVVQNFGWNVAGSIGARVIAPIFSILVARILTPEAYGIFGLSIAFVAFFELFKDLGLTQTVIVDHEEEDFLSLQFTIQISLAVFLYGIIFFASPLAAKFYKMPDLSLVIRLVGLTLFMSCIEDPLVTHYLKANHYKLLFVRQIVPSMIFGIVAFASASLGWGVYALVIAHVVGRFSTVPFLFVKAGWVPRFHFDRDVFLRLLRTGKHIIFQQLCSFMVMQGDALIVGKNLGAGVLGAYRMGGTFATLIPNSSIPQVQQVVFTDLAKHKDNMGYLIARYFHFVYGIGAASLVLSVLTFVAAPYLVPLFLGAKWSQTIPVIQLFSVLVPFVPLVALNADIATIYGFRGVYSGYMLIRSLSSVIILCWASTLSLEAVLISWVLLSILFAIISAVIFFRAQAMIRATAGVVFMFALCTLYAVLAIMYLYGNRYL